MYLLQSRQTAKVPCHGPHSPLPFFPHPPLPSPSLTPSLFSPCFDSSPRTPSPLSLPLSLPFFHLYFSSAAPPLIHPFIPLSDFLPSSPVLPSLFPILFPLFLVLLVPFLPFFTIHPSIHLSFSLPLFALLPYTLLFLLLPIYLFCVSPCSYSAFPALL